MFLLALSCLNTCNLKPVLFFFLWWKTKTKTVGAFVLYRQMTSIFQLHKYRFLRGATLDSLPKKMKHRNVLGPVLLLFTRSWCKSGPDTQAKVKKGLCMHRDTFPPCLWWGFFTLQNSPRSLKLKQADKGCGKTSVLLICVGEISKCWMMILTLQVLLQT